MEILRYEKVNKNKTIGTVDIRIPILKPTVLILRRIAHVQIGERKWFNFPAFCHEEENGKKIYLKYAEFEAPEVNNYLLGNLSDKVKEYCEKHGISNEQAIPMPSFENDKDYLPF